MYTVMCTLYSKTEYRDPTLSPLTYSVYTTFTIYGMLFLYYMKTTVLCRSISDSFMIKSQSSTNHCRTVDADPELLISDTMDSNSHKISFYESECGSGS